MNHTLRKATLEDLDALASISIQTFADTFGAANDPKTLADYLEQAYNKDRLAKELANPNSAFYLLYVDGQLAGYLKLNVSEAQSELQDPSALEVERIYVDRRFQKQGLGAVLMDFAIEQAKEKGKDYIWLGVWEKNANALAFYKRNGFYQIGAHDFVMGDERQTDYMMRKDL